MKKSLKLFLCALALGVMATAPALRAQDEKAPPAEGGRKGGGGRGGRGQMMSPEQQVARLEEAVGKLTDDQKTKITAVYEKAAKDMQALRGSGDPQSNREKMQELMQNTRKDVRALLTADQQKKFDDMPAPGRGGGRKKGNN